MDGTPVIEQLTLDLPYDPNTIPPGYGLISEEQFTDILPKQFLSTSSVLQNLFRSIFRSYPDTLRLLEKDAIDIENIMSESDAIPYTFKLTSRIFRQNGTIFMVGLNNNRIEIDSGLLHLLYMLDEADWNILKFVLERIPLELFDEQSIPAKLGLLAREDGLPRWLDPRNIQHFLSINLQMRTSINNSPLSFELWDYGEDQAEKLLSIRELGTRGLNDATRVVSSVVGKLLHCSLRSGIPPMDRISGFLRAHFSYAIAELDKYLAMYEDEWPDINFFRSLATPENPAFHQAYLKTAEFLAIILGNRLGVIGDDGVFGRYDETKTICSQVLTRWGLDMRVLMDCFIPQELTDLQVEFESRFELANFDERLGLLIKFIETRYGDLIFRVLACFLAMERLREDPLSHLSGFGHYEVQLPDLQYADLPRKQSTNGLRADVLFLPSELKGHIGDYFAELKPDAEVVIVEVKTTFTGKVNRAHLLQLLNQRTRVQEYSWLVDPTCYILYISPYGTRLVSANKELGKLRYDLSRKREP